MIPLMLYTVVLKSTGMIVMINTLSVYENGSTLTLRSLRICRLNTCIYAKKINRTKSNAATEPRFVPSVPPAAPYAAP